MNRINLLIHKSTCAQEIQFCRKLAAELGFRQYAPTPLFEDNTGVSLSQNMGILQSGLNISIVAGCLSPILYEM